MGFCGWKSCDDFLSIPFVKNLFGFSCKNAPPLIEFKKGFYMGF